MAEIRAHEQKHADDYQDLVKQANARLTKQRPIPVQACFPHLPTQAAIQQEWNKKVEKALAASFKSLQDRAVRAEKYFDKRQSDPDAPCDACKPCGPTEVAQCNSCSDCNTKFGVCEAKPGCIPPPTCCCWKYVLGEQGCQVGTIEKTFCEQMNVPNVVSAQCSFPCTDTAPMCK
jgi:hypothetical protein